MFNNLDKIGYERYLKKFPFHKNLNIDIAEYLKKYQLNSISQKVRGDIWTCISRSNTEPYQAELDDLIRLHYLVTSRKVTTILEFGVGVSTFVLNHALVENQKRYSSFVSANLRRSNAFELHSVDSDSKWIKHVSKNYHLPNTRIYKEKCRMGTFRGLICTYYRKIPNICPDLIYLDGPHQFSVRGKSVRGISTKHLDRVPLAADILAIEWFLLPGTLIIIDGRTTNARFLKSNLQRNWKYTENSEYDQHFLELIEPPIGDLNKRQLLLSQVITTRKSRNK